MVTHTDLVASLLVLPYIGVNKPNDEGDTPLLNAAYGGHLDIVTLLLAYPDIGLNKTNQFGPASLSYASDKGHFDIVTALLAHPNIEVNKTDQHGGAPLYCASKNGHSDVVTLLLAHPDMDVNITNQEEEEAALQKMVIRHRHPASYSSRHCRLTNMGIHHFSVQQPMVIWAASPPSSPIRISM